METDKKKIAIIGAGPCGLGAGWALKERGHKDWAILERNGHVGGLSASFKDEKGFTWDIGGHVLFSHYPVFDQIINKAMGDDGLISHYRKSFVRSNNTWVPYPFQNNLSFLPPDVQSECLQGLKEADRESEVENFDDWIQAVFGKGIARHFMQPYNWKVWGVPLKEMSFHWIKERVSVIDYESVLKNINLAKEEITWGPNERFAFPKNGGTGEIFRRIALEFNDRIELNSSIKAISSEKKTIYFNNGETREYDSLITTIPLDQLLDLITDAPSSVKERAKGLVHNSVLVVGLGFLSPLQDKERCWFYFPGKKSPFYRVTNFAKYSHNNVPGGETDKYCSYLCETAYSDHKNVDKNEIIDLTKMGLIEEGVITEEVSLKEISRHLIDVDYAYPIPSIDRDDILNAVQPFLMERDIFSRGRFGAWRYEVGNMDHSFKMGMEAVDFILDGVPEKVWGS